jgi:hypothetical protein
LAGKQWRREEAEGEKRNWNRECGQYEEYSIHFNTEDGPCNTRSDERVCHGHDEATNRSSRIHASARNAKNEFAWYLSDFAVVFLLHR